MNTPVIFIAGPMQGFQHFNSVEFSTADQALKNKGFITRSPWSFHGTVGAKTFEDGSIQRHALQMMTNECTDMLCLPEWRQDEFCKIVVKAAIHCGINVFENYEDLIAKYTNET